MTRKEKRAVIAALARWEPIAPSVELTARDRTELREQAAMTLAPMLGIEQEAALVWLDSTRMTS